jgi:hypothetical protein
MVIKSKTGILSHKLIGDNEIFTHYQDITPALYEASESRKSFDPSMMVGRNAWPVACVPELIFKRFTHNGTVDWKQFDKWLNSDYGKGFKADR